MSVKPTLKQQIAAVQNHVRLNERSYRHLIGDYAGRIPPGPEFDETRALRAAVQTLKNHRIQNAK